MDTEPARPCAFCASPARLLCARCLNVAFCDEACQRRAWRDHKALCVPAATAATAVVVSSRRAGAAAAEFAKLHHAAAVAAAYAKMATMTDRRVVALMVASPRDAAIVESGVSILQQRASLPVENRDSLVAAGAFPVLASALLEHADSLQIVSIASHALNKMCFASTAKGVVAAGAALKPLAAALRTHASSETATLVASRATQNIVIVLNYDGCRSAAADAILAIVPLLGVLRAHRNAASNCAAASSAISAIVGVLGDNARDLALEAHALPLLVSAMCTHTNDASVSEHASNAIGNLAQAGLACMTALFAAGALVPLLAALRTHVKSPDVVLATSGALGNFMFSDENAKAAQAAGVLTSLLVALRIHASDARVCENITKAIDNLLAVPTLRVGGAVAAVAPLLATLKTHVADATVTKFACSALARLFDGEPNFGPGVIAAPKDVEAVVAASVVASQTAIATGMAPVLLIAALRTHASDPIVCLSAIRSIGNFTCTRAGADAARDAGAVALISTALRVHASDAGFCSAAIIALWRLIPVEPSAAAAMAADIAPLISAALSRHGDKACPGVRGILAGAMRLIEEGRWRVEAAAAAEAGGDHSDPPPPP